MKWTKKRKVHYRMKLNGQMHGAACCMIISYIQFGDIKKYNYLCNLNNL